MTFLPAATNPNVLVDTDWVAHLNDASIRIIESNEDPLLYPSNILRGESIAADLNDLLRRDYLDRDGEKLASKIGITPTRRWRSTRQEQLVATMHSVQLSGTNAASAGRLKWR
ncbi:MAG: hypothetical protein U0694_23335 [Anaerolineae bacterium]